MQVATEASDTGVAVVRRYPQIFLIGYLGFGSTIPILSTPLHARYIRPSGVAAMFRTTPPPDGIVARANFSEEDRI